VATNCDFSGIRAYVNLVARRYLPGTPDPEAEHMAPDSDPDGTQKIIAALGRAGRGSVDESVFILDAAEPIGFDEVAGFLKTAAPFTYAGRARLTGQGLRMHGHELVDYLTLRTQMEGAVLYLTFYRDRAGKVAYIEQTS